MQIKFAKVASCQGCICCNPEASARSRVVTNVAVVEPYHAVHHSPARRTKPDPGANTYRG